MKYFLSFLIFSIFSLGVGAQEVLENIPSSIPWHQINTPNFRILYPGGFEKQAQRMANTLESIRLPEASSFGARTRKISILLQSQSSVSNGFVSMVPRRSEFYALPPQDYNFTGTNDWLDMLATHEYRHVVQFDAARKGFSNLIYYLFGPATFSGIAQGSVPQWFWEGDAVAAETTFTESGRGRIPNFGLVFRTNILEGRSFNYHKQYLRSYKHFIPDHYVLGFHMVSYLRTKTSDPNSWGRISRKAWSVPFIPFAFSNSIKKESGLYVTQLYNEMASVLKEEWQKEVNQLELTSFEVVPHRRRRGYTNYNFPQVLGDGNVLAMKDGIGDIEQFVVLANGKEERIFTPGIINESGMLSAAGPWVVWNEHTYDPRWLARNYSVIKMLNVETDELKILTKHSRYAGAALSPDASKIVTVETTTGYKSRIAILDTEGNEIKKFANPDNHFYSMPRWTENGQKIVALKTAKEGRSVVLVDTLTGEETLLFGPGNENVGHPVIHGKYLLYNSGISGIDNIYAFDLDSRTRYMVTSSKYGSYNPCLSSDGSKLYYSEQTRDGLEIAMTSFEPSRWKRFNHRQSQSQSLADQITDQDGRDLLNSIPNNQYPTKGYRRVSGIINPYSWGVVFDDTFTNLDVGISSRDILSTASLKVGYVFDIYERTGAYRAGLSYQGKFPILDVNATYANRSVDEGNLWLLAIDTVQVMPQVELDSIDFARNLTFEWEESNIEAGLRVPLITTNGRFHGGVTFANYVGYTKVRDFTNSITNSQRVIPYVYRSGPSTPLQSVDGPAYFFRDYVAEGTLLYDHFEFSAYRLLKQSRRDINSRWGQVVYLDLYNTIPDSDYSGHQLSFYSMLYFPGFWKHHSIWGYWGYQGTILKNEITNYVFRNAIPLPRGQSISRFEKFYSMSINYTLPVWYPDIAIGPLLNIQRFRANGFVDYGYGSTVTSTSVFEQDYISVGGELKVDFNVMRALPQLNVGVRYTYGVRPSVTKFEILIGTINF